MRADEIRSHLRRKPFLPLNIHMSDGSSYPVRHPALAFVTRRDLVIALDPGDDRIPDRSVYRDPMHVTRIEPLA